MQGISGQCAETEQTGFTAADLCWVTPSPLLLPTLKLPC